jgi:prevent-host-death family protein
MRQIGVRELRQNASEYLRLVQTGESFEVTDHGRPVAQLVPLAAKKESTLDRLIREGTVRPPERPGRITQIVKVRRKASSGLTSEQVFDEMREERV